MLFQSQFVKILYIYSHTRIIRNQKKQMTININNNARSKFFFIEYRCMISKIFHTLDPDHERIIYGFAIFIILIYLLY